MTKASKTSQGDVISQTEIKELRDSSGIGGYDIFAPNGFEISLDGEYWTTEVVVPASFDRSQIQIREIGADGSETDCSHEEGQE